MDEHRPFPGGGQEAQPPRKGVPSGSWGALAPKCSQEEQRVPLGGLRPLRSGQPANASGRTKPALLTRSHNSSLRRCQRGKRQGASRREGGPLRLGVATPPAAHKHSSRTGTHQASSSSHRLGQRLKVSVTQSLHLQSRAGCFRGRSWRALEGPLKQDDAGGAWSSSSPEPREPARLRSPGLHRAGIRRRALAGPPGGRL